MFGCGCVCVYVCVCVSVCFFLTVTALPGIIVGTDEDVDENWKSEFTSASPLRRKDTKSSLCPGDPRHHAENEILASFIERRGAEGMTT